MWIELNCWPHAYGYSIGTMVSVMSCIPYSQKIWRGTSCIDMLDIWYIYLWTLLHRLTWTLTENHRYSLDTPPPPPHLVAQQPVHQGHTHHCTLHTHTMTQRPQCDTLHLNVDHSCLFHTLQISHLVRFRKLTNSSIQTTLACGREKNISHKHHI